MCVCKWRGSEYSFHLPCLQNIYASLLPLLKLRRRRKKSSNAAIARHGSLLAVVSANWALVDLVERSAAGAPLPAVRGRAGGAKL